MTDRISWSSIAFSVVSRVLHVGASTIAACMSSYEDVREVRLEVLLEVLLEAIVRLSALCRGISSLSKTLEFRFEVIVES